MLKANTVADYFIHLSTPGSKENITNLKLQKLLYYAQGMFLAEMDEDYLFEEEIQAWKHGPVVPVVYRRFSSYIFNEISTEEINEESVHLVESKQLNVFLNKVWVKYGKYNGKQLERMSHMEHPWLSTRDELPSYVSSNEKIPNKLIKDYFSEKSEA